MKINGRQMEVLTEIVREEFHRRLAAFARDELSGEIGSLTDDELADRVAQVHDQAIAYGIESEVAVARFFCIRVAVGLDSPMPEEIGRLMDTDPTVTADDKVAFLVEMLSSAEKGSVE